MFKTFFKSALCLGISVGLYAQSPSAFPYSKPIPNDPSTGTTQFKLVKINTSGNAVIMATTDTTGFTGVAVSNAGTSGSVWLAFQGLVPLVMDGTATAGHYVQISSSVNGDGHDTAAATWPSSGGDVVGKVQVGCTGAACVAMVDEFPPGSRADNSGSSPIAGSQISVSGSTVSFNPFDFGTLIGREDFCGNNSHQASGASAVFFSRYAYANLNSAGSSIESVDPCGVTLTTDTTSGHTAAITLYTGALGQMTLVPGTMAFTLEFVFKTSSATTAGFSISVGSDNFSPGRGASNGFAVQALAGATDITLTTCAGSACTATAIDSTVAYVSNTVYKATVVSDGAGNICMTVNAGGSHCTSMHVTSTKSSDVGIEWALANSSAASNTATLLGWSYSIPGF